jgi:hypothetical protein
MELPPKVSRIVELLTRKTRKGREKRENCKPNVFVVGRDRLSRQYNRKKGLRSFPVSWLFFAFFA